MNKKCNKPKRAQRTRGPLYICYTSFFISNNQLQSKSESTTGNASKLMHWFQVWKVVIPVNRES